MRHFVESRIAIITFMRRDMYTRTEVSAYVRGASAFGCFSRPCEGSGRIWRGAECGLRLWRGWGSRQHVTPVSAAGMALPPFDSAAMRQPHRTCCAGVVVVVCKGAVLRGRVSEHWHVPQESSAPCQTAPLQPPGLVGHPPNKIVISPSFHKQAILDAQQS